MNSYLFTTRLDKQHLIKADSYSKAYQEFGRIVNEKYPTFLSVMFIK